MAQLSTSRIITLLEDNCKSRLSCSGCTMSGKHSLKDTCLLRELKQSEKQHPLSAYPLIPQVIQTADGFITIR